MMRMQMVTQMLKAFVPVGQQETPFKVCCSMLYVNAGWQCARHHLLTCIFNALAWARRRHRARSVLRTASVPSRLEPGKYEQPVSVQGANFLGQGFTYLPEAKRNDLYGYHPKVASTTAAFPCLPPRRPPIVDFTYTRELADQPGPPSRLAEGC